MKFLFFLFFLLIPIVYGIDGNIIGGQSFTIGTVEKCVGDIDITIRADKDIDDNEYNFTNCTISYGNDRRENWECSCNQTPFDVIMNTNKNAVNGYDFEIEYSKTEVILKSGEKILLDVAYSQMVLVIKKWLSQIPSEVEPTPETEGELLQEEKPKPKSKKGEK